MVLLFASTSGSKNSGSAFLATAVTFTQHRKLTISMAVSGAMTLQVSKDNGSNYYDGYTFSGAGAQDLTLWVKAGDVLNFKQTSGGAITLGWFDVFAQESI